MFAITPLEPASVFLSFKASPETFVELTERADIIPAPYLARAQWVALQTKDDLPVQPNSGSQGLRRQQAVCWWWQIRKSTLCLWLTPAIAANSQKYRWE